MSKCVIGLRESLRNIKSNKASSVILAMDSDDHVIDEVLGACEDYGVPVKRVERKRDLGTAYGIERPAAVVTLLR